MKNLQKIEETITQLEIRRQELFSLKEPIDDELVSNYKELEKEKSKRDSIIKETQNDNWEWILETDGNESTEKYNFTNKRLAEIGLSKSGCYSKELKQCSVRVCLTRDGKAFDKTISGLKLILPFIKTVEGKTKILSIFEHTLSQHGIYDLRIKGNEFSIGITRYGRLSIEMVFNKLEAAIKYIQDNHWYE